MANKTITQLSPVASVEAADEFEVQKSGETITKKATLTQVTQVEATVRAASDDAIELSVGLNTNGTYPSFENSWHLRIEDHDTIVDRSGVVEELPLDLKNALRILDYYIYRLETVPMFGVSPNYTTFINGVMQSFGTATTFDDIYPSSVSTAGGASAPSFTAYNGALKAYEFLGAATMKEIHIGFQLNHKYKIGSTVSPHIHLYIPNDVTGGTILFGLEYTFAAIDQVGVIAPVIVYGSLVVGANAGIFNNAILEFTDIVGTGKGISSVIMCRLFRDPTVGGDTFASSVWLKSCDIHIEQDHLGSDTEFTQ
jgi:hypothetical protein